MKKTFLLVLLIIYSLSGVTAQIDSLGIDSTTIHRLSLDDATNYAVEHNYQNQNSALEIKIAKKQIWETTAIGLPQVEATGEYQNMIQIPTQILPDFISPSIVAVNEALGVDMPNAQNFTPGGSTPVQFGQQHSLTGAITATQLIFSGEYIVGLQASRIFLELSKQGYSKSTKTIKEMVTKSYYLALVAEESKKILEETNKNFENLLREIEESHRLGFVEDIDVDQLRLTKQNNDNTIISINNQIDLTRRLLKFQLGISYQDSLVLVDSLGGFVESLDFEEILYKEFDLNKNIDYKLIQTQEGLAMLDLKREKSTYLPQLTAFFTHSQATYSNDFADIGNKWFPSTIIGLQLKVPLFSSGSRRSKVQQKKLVLEQTQNQKIELEQNLQLQVEQSKTDFINAKNTFENQKLSMQLSKRINDKTEIKYKKGMASGNDLMIAQNQYLGALNTYYQALNKLLDARATLEYLLQED
jgi:outer membrane protein